MPTTTKQTLVALWHYTCPECGVGDRDTGHYAVSDIVYCEVCLEQDQRPVRLKRWQVDESGSPSGGGR